MAQVRLDAARPTTPVRPRRRPHLRAPDLASVPAADLVGVGGGVGILGGVTSGDALVLAAGAAVYFASFAWSIAAYAAEDAPPD